MLYCYDIPSRPLPLSPLPKLDIYQNYTFTKLHLYYYFIINNKAKNPVTEYRAAHYASLQ